MARRSDDADAKASRTETAAAPAPRENPFLIGHEAAEAQLLAAYRAGRLPHAIILGGPRGIGKATLAFRLARFLFAESRHSGGPSGEAGPGSLAVPPDHPVFKRVAAAGHADLLTVEREIDPRTKRLRGEIVVQDTRTIASFLRLTPAEGGWRIVIVDGADDMNRNAANALLKILEEPPRNALLMLVAHQAGRLLPTIRSRCRRLTLKPLSDADLAGLLQRYQPDMSEAERAALAHLAEGSIGRALDLAVSGGLDLYRDLLKLIIRLPVLDGVALHALAERIAPAEAADSFRTLTELLTGWLGRMVSLAAQGYPPTSLSNAILPGEAEAMHRLAARRSLDQWVEVWEKMNRLFAQADGLNLDRRQVLLNAIFALEAASR
jgi:DNA polymerase III subunit delta'